MVSLFLMISLFPMVSLFLMVSLFPMVSHFQIVNHFSMVTRFLTVTLNLCLQRSILLVERADKKFSTINLAHWESERESSSNSALAPLRAQISLSSQWSILAIEKLNETLFQQSTSPIEKGKETLSQWPFLPVERAWTISFSMVLLTRWETIGRLSFMETNPVETSTCKQSRVCYSQGLLHTYIEPNMLLICILEISILALIQRCSTRARALVRTFKILSFCFHLQC